MMSDNVLVQPLFHQRSHSMPVGNAFINNNNPNMIEDNSDNYRNFDFKRKPENTNTNDGFPLPIPKSMTSQFRSTTLAETTTLEEFKDSNNIEPSFFCTPKTLLDVFEYNKKDTSSCPLILNCKMDRGFFISQSHWTCYRRNYFQVTASFIIPGHSDQSCYALQLSSDKPMQPIQQFFLRLRACTSISNNSNNDITLKNHSLIKPIALTQMTPKRDKGPQREPPTVPINPSDNLFGSEQVCVTFERLQFRVATANNGKRRASQQFFRLIFELAAQLDDGTQHVVAECYSSPLVVRGRSPGHYSSDPQYEIRRKRKPSTSKIAKKTFEDYTSSSTSSSSPHQPQNESIVSLPPPPQYVYTPPAMIPMDTPRPSNDMSYTPIMSNMFNPYHNRSQSANDSEFFARHRFKYQNNEIFDHNYNIWQQQINRQRTDSATTFMSNEKLTNNNNNNNNSQLYDWPNRHPFYEQKQPNPNYHQDHQ